MTWRLDRLRISAGLCFVLGLTFVSSAHAQEAIGAKFGARDPRICSSRTEALSVATATEYFICDSEFAEGPNASGEKLHLVSDVKIELGRQRKFDSNTDTFGFAETNSIDPSQPVVPIRGSFNDWTCRKLGDMHGERGKNCNLTSDSHATGLCFTNSFGDWHCTMTDLHAAGEYLPSHPPPSQP